MHHVSPPSAPERVVVIGGGYSGTACAIHLSRAAPTAMDIVVVEPRERVGGGLAHSSADPDHRLNAPDVIHLLYPEAPEHFRSWLAASGRLAADPEAWWPDGRLYPRRGDFGAYLAAEFAAHAAANPSGSQLSHIRARARVLEPRGAGYRVVLDDDSALEVDRCVLGLGQEPARMRLPGLHGDAPDPRLIDDPFAADALAAVEPSADVLILGSGLTAADTVATLIRRGHRGAIVCLSRRGLRPQGQNPARATGSLWEHLNRTPPALIERHGLPAHLRTLVRQVRDDARQRQRRGEPWHAAVDEVRDAAGELWNALSHADRRRFLRHLKPYYDSHRFRIPPQTAAILDDATNAGRLVFETGRLDAVTAAGGVFEVTWTPRGGGRSTTRRCGAIVNCAGFAPRIDGTRNALLRSCLAQGLVRPSDTGRSLDGDDRGRLLAADGTPQRRLLALGPMLLDRFGETPAAVFVLRQVMRLLPVLLGGERLSPADRT